MELLSVIRRWRFRDHFSIRAISRRTGLSRNTVRRYLRSDSEEPKFKHPIKGRAADLQNLLCFGDGICAPSERSFIRRIGLRHLVDHFSERLGSFQGVACGRRQYARF